LGKSSETGTSSLMQRGKLPFHAKFSGLKHRFPTGFYHATCKASRETSSGKGLRPPLAEDHGDLGFEKTDWRHSIEEVDFNENPFYGFLGNEFSLLHEEAITGIPFLSHPSESAKAPAEAGKIFYAFSVSEVYFNLGQSLPEVPEEVNPRAGIKTSSEI